MSSTSAAEAQGTLITNETTNPTGSAAAAAAVLAEAVSIAAHAEAAVAAQAAADARAAGAEASAGAVKAAARAEAAAATAVAEANAAAAETASARSVVVVTEADLSAATTAMAFAHSGTDTHADHSTDDRVEAALLTAAAAAAILAKAVAGESAARSVAANKVALAVTVAATAAALTATANAAATRDDVTAAAMLSATITAILAATVTAAQDTQAEADLTVAATAPPARPALPTTTVSRLTDLLDGLDDAVGLEWETYLSAPVAPVSLPGGSDEEIGSATSRGLYGLARDLTLARRIELAMSRTAGRAEGAFVNAPVALLHADFDGHHMIRFTRVNAALCDLTGYTEAELLALDARALSHPGDDATQSDVLENRYHPGDDRQEVLRWMHARGHSIWVRLTLRALLSDDGLADQVVGQVEDVTARRRVESALRHSEKQFRVAFDNAPVPMMLIELTGARPATLLHANAAVSRLTGYTEGELKASDFPALLGRSLSETQARPLPAGNLSGVNRYRHAAGHTFLVRCDAHLLVGEDGESDTLLAQLSKVASSDPAELPDTYERIS